MAATSTSSDPSTVDGPVLNVINKRLRALRKKHNRILQMEDSISQGKTLNNEQQEVLRSKPSVLALIDELEKLRSPISSAVEEEISLAVKQHQQQHKEEEEKVVAVVGSREGDFGNNDDVSETTRSENHHRLGDGVVKDLLNLMYFGSLFDVKPQSDFTSLMITRSHERSCCLTYDYVTDDATDLLGDKDLDLISALQGLMVSRPVNSPVSHQNALEMCVHHAKLWLESSQQPIDPQSNVTYAGLKEKLNKIMASDYFTATPQMKGPGEVAAAAAVGNFGSFQVPMHESLAPVDVPVEGSVEHYPDTEKNAANYEEYETGEHQTGNVDEFQKDDVEAENPAEMVSAHTELEQAHAGEEQGYRNADYREQQYIPRRGQRGGRGGGGGRRGFPNGRGGRGNGRGGGPYQNGRNQYNENYYPRNNYYNRRGGRGTGGAGSGGNPHYQSSAGQGNNTQANMGVAS